MSKSFINGSRIYTILAIVIIPIFISGIHVTDKTSSNEAMRLATESIKRATITCYAIEGSYPPSFEYLKENYNLSIDETAFAIHYEIFASNIMPEITVIAR